MSDLPIKVEVEIKAENFGALNGNAVTTETAADDKKHLFFGSLEHAERERLARQQTTGEADTVGVSDAIQAGIRAGNINISIGPGIFQLLPSI